MKVGKVKSGRSKEDYYVYWDRDDQKVYVGLVNQWADGRSSIHMKASSASEACDQAEAYLRSK
mgnify:CR=1 FL=1